MDQRFSLPADVAPGASATLPITVTALGNSGPMILEYQMLKSTLFWFDIIKDVGVSVQTGAALQVEFPRFDGHLMAGPSGLAWRMSVDAQDPAVFAGVQA